MTINNEPNEAILVLLKWSLKIVDNSKINKRISKEWYNIYEQ